MSESIEIREVGDKKGLADFIRVPKIVNRGDPNWVCPLDMQEKARFNAKKNPFFEHTDIVFLVAYKGGRPAGRMTAHIDHNYNEFHDERTGQFGFFDSIEDLEIAKALTGHAERWLEGRGMEVILGPFSFNTNDMVGVLVEGFNSPPMIMMPYNPPYYESLFLGCGFERAKDLLAYNIDFNEEFIAFADRLRTRLEPLVKKAEADGFTIRNLNLKNFDEETQRLMGVYNEAWESNWGAVPMTEAEFIHLCKELKPIAVPELTKFVEFGDETVAFGLCLPDVNQIFRKMNGKLFPFGLFRLLLGLKKVDGMRLLALGVKKGYRKRGADSLMYYHLLNSVLELNRFKTCEISWLLEDNYLIIRAAEFMRGKLYKRYRMYRKSL
jgi:hypothetical protein